MTIIISKSDSSYLLNPDNEEKPPLELFDINWLEKNGSITAKKSAGRGNIIYFNHQQHKLVLRRYYRGGAAGKFSHSRYLWSGMNNTRAYKEIYLLEKLYRLGLPISKPFAARVYRGSLSYQAALITHEIEGSNSLGEVLKNSDIPAIAWQHVGATIRRFHDLGVFHADLNANNILLKGTERAYLIDFDKGSIRNSENNKWKQQNLDRLKRSLIKLKGTISGFHYDDESWAYLLAGYNSATIAR